MPYTTKICVTQIVFDQRGKLIPVVNYVLSFDPQISTNVRQVWKGVNTNAETRMVAFNVFARLVTSWILIIGLAQVTLAFFSKEQQWRIPFIFIKLSSNEDNFLNVRLWRCYYLWTCSPRKQPTFGDATTGFPAKWRVRNERRNSILLKRHYQIWVVFWLVVPSGKFISTNQKHYPDLGSDASSVWNFCARFSDVVWRRNLW